MHVALVATCAVFPYKPNAPDTKNIQEVKNAVDD